MCDTIHLPPGPLRAVNHCRRLATRARALRAPAAGCRRQHREDLPPLLVQSRQRGSRYQIRAHQIRPLKEARPSVCPPALPDGTDARGIIATAHYTQGPR